MDRLSVKMRVENQKFLNNRTDERMGEEGDESSSRKWSIESENPIQNWD